MVNVDIGSNLIGNPTLKTTTSGWSNSSGTVLKSSIGGRFQTASGTQNPAKYKFTARPGYKYALTGVQYRKNNATASLFSVYVVWYNSAGSSISSSTPIVAPAATQNVWNSLARYEVTAPAGTSYGLLYPRQSTSTQAMDYYATNFILKRYVVAPSVNAGVDQSKVQGESVTLTATATPGDGAISKYAWTKVTGSPSPATPTTASTSVGPFPNIETATYRMTVTDAYGVTATDEVVVNVAAGPAPVVEAGPFSTVYVGGTATLTGSASSVAGIASWAWTEKSTSGVVITSPTAAITDVGPFTMPGSYTFQLKVTDVNGKAGVDTAIITVIPVPDSTSINSRTRLEVLADDVTNLVDNHSGQTGATYPWFTGTPGMTIAAPSGNAFGFDGFALRTTSDNGGHSIATLVNSIPVVPGEWVMVTANWRFTIPSVSSVAKVATQVDFYNSSYNRVGGSPSANDSGTEYLNTSYLSGTDYSARMIGDTAYQVPEGAVWASPRIWVIFQGSPAASTVYYWNIGALKGPTKEAVTSVPFAYSGDYWQNLLSTSTSVDLSRGNQIEGVTDSLETGLLTAVIPDPAATPDQNKRVRPGKKIRVTAFNNVSAEWEPVWTGTIAEVNTSYRDKRPVVSIAATDAVADLENIATPVGKSGAFRQRVDAILLDTPVLYEVTDTDSDTTSDTITVEEDASAIDQLEMASNSVHGFIYVDKSNTVQALAPNSAPSQTPVVTFSDSHLDVAAIKYTDIDVNFGSKALINSLNVELHDATGVNGQYTFGPYLNAESVANWGTQSATLVINSGAPDVQAGYYLSTFSDPSVFCNSVTFRSDNNLYQSIGLEIYQAARVKFEDAGLDAVYRIINIEHRILPDGWETRVFFRPMEATSSIVVQVPALGPLTGPVDLLPPKPVGIETPLSPWTSGSVTFQRIGNTVIAIGGVARASGSAATFTNAVDIPLGFRPPSSFLLPSSTFLLGSTVYYQYLVNTTALQIRQSASNANAAYINASWITTDPYPS